MASGLRSLGCSVNSPCALCRGEERVRLFSKGGKDFLGCKSCGLVWVDPLPTPAELSSHYERSYREGGYSMFADAEDIRQGIAEYRLAVVQPFARPGRWLDVGCSGGQFIEAAQKAGVEAEGLDLSAGAIARARERGLTAHHSSVENFAPERPFETITAFDVIEHSLDPRAFVKCCHTWLVPRGTLVLTLPDVGSIYPRLLMRRHWFYYAPHEHLFYFDRRTISRLLSEEGFVVDQVSRTYKPLSLRYSAESLSLFNDKLGRITKRLVSGLPQNLSTRKWKLYVGEMLVRATRT